MLIPAIPKPPEKKKTVRMNATEFIRRTEDVIGMGKLEEFPGSMLFTVPILPPGLNGQCGLIRMHWTAKSKLTDAWVQILSEARGGSKTTFKQCAVVFTLFVTRLWDWDNCSASFKLVGDGLVKSGVLSNDSPAVIKSFKTEQVKVKDKAEVGCSVLLTRFVS